LKVTEAEGSLHFGRGSKSDSISTFALILLTNGHKYPYPFCYTTGAGGVANKYFCGGPRLPNTTMVISVPVLQQGHLRNNVFTATWPLDFTDLSSFSLCSG